MREKKNVYKGFLWVSLKERGHLDDLGVDGIITSTRSGMGWCGLGLSG